MKPTKLLLWITVLLLTLQFVAALGVRPAKTTITFEEFYDKEEIKDLKNFKEYSGEFWVVNNDAQIFKLKVSVDGEMAKYITLNTTELYFRDYDDAQPVEFKIKIPKNIPPGESSASIIVEQDTESYNPLVIASKVVLRHKIIVVGPYPDKYLKIKLNFREDHDKIKLISEVENFGKENINSVKTTFYVNDQEQQEHSLETEKVSLGRKENKLLTAELERKVFEQGEFEVLAVVQYDDEQQEISSKMILGQPEIDITYFDKYFIANQVNQYTLDLLNKWNQKIRNVFVDVHVLRDGEMIDEFRTRSLDLEGLTPGRIQDYFDAEGKRLGKYSFEMVVNYWNTYSMDAKTFEAEIVPEKDFEKLGLAPPEPLAGKATAKPASGRSVTSTLFWVLLGMVIAGIAGFVIYRYKNRQKYEGGDEAF